LLQLKVYVFHSTSTQAHATAVDLNVTSVIIPLWLNFLLTAAAMGVLIGGVSYFRYRRWRTAPPQVAEAEQGSEFPLLDRNLPHQRQAAPNLHTLPPPPYTKWDENPKFVSHHKTLPNEAKTVSNL
jgi:hypothetical protein